MTPHRPVQSYPSSAAYSQSPEQSSAASYSTALPKASGTTMPGPVTADVHTIAATSTLARTFFIQASGTLTNFMMMMRTRDTTMVTATSKLHKAGATDLYRTNPYLRYRPLMQCEMTWHVLLVMFGNKTMPTRIPSINQGTSVLNQRRPCITPPISPPFDNWKYESALAVGSHATIHRVSAL
jgi:hypothetical protein